LQVAVPTIMQSNLHTTAAYQYTQFEPNPTAVELRGLAAGRGPGGLAAAAVALCALAVALGLRRLRARAS
jgi:hypothetical protein